MATAVSITPSKSATVAQILWGVEGTVEPGATERLEQAGIRRCWLDRNGPKEQEVVAVHTPTVLRSILRGTLWAEQDISQILNRIDGSFRRVVRVAGSTRKCIVFDADRLASLVDDAAIDNKSSQERANDGDF